MIIGVDTSTSILKLGLADDEKVISQISMKVEGSHTRKLLPALNFLMTENQVTKSQIDSFAVVTGPGSFTGLRIGLATIMGICVAWKIKSLPVTSGDIAARALKQVISTSRFLYLVDGKRKEVFVMDYKPDKNGDLVMEDEILVFNYSKAMEYCNSNKSGGVTVAGDGISKLVEAGFEFGPEIKVIDRPDYGFNGGDIARFAKFVSPGETDRLEPLYVREPDIR